MLKKPKFGKKFRGCIDERQVAGTELLWSSLSETHDNNDADFEPDAARGFTDGVSRRA